MSAQATWPPGDGEMSRRIREHDWAATPLGPIDSWPGELKGMVEIMLATPLISSVVCGTRRILLYNDALARLYSDKHPFALGRPLSATWPEDGEVAKALYDRVFAGETVHVPAQPLDLLSRGEEPEIFDAYVTPVRGPVGQVAYAHMTGFEISARLRAERQTARAEERLRASEARFRALTTASTTMIYRMSPDWRLMHQLSGRNMLADTLEPVDDWAEGYLLSEDRPAIFSAIDEAIRTKSLFDLEHRVRRADGGVGWVHSRAVPMLGPDGQIIEWFGSASDVTERRESAERLQRVLETDAVAVLFFSHDGELINANEVFLRMSGYSREDVVSGQLTWQQMTPEEWHAESQSQMDGFLVTGRIGPYEKEYLRKDGSRAWMLFTGRDLGDGTIVEIGVDIGDRKRAEAALRESEERFRQFGEASQDVLWVRDAETFQWEYLTPAFETIYGLDRESALRGNNMTGWLNLIVPEDRDHAAAELARVRSGEWATFEFRIRRPVDGELRWLRETDFPIKDDTGRVIRIGGIGHDVTGEKETTERMGVLVAELQHRTRNLMSVVRSIGEQTLRSSASLSDFMPIFRDRMMALARVNGLLSRLADGHRLTFDELIRSEIDALGPIAKEEGRVSLGGPGGVRLRSSTVQTFALAMHELATNAVKYGALRQEDNGQPGRLAVTWKLAWDGGRPWLHVDWRESGVAMPRNDVPSLEGGAGRQLIERALPYQLGAKTTFVMEADGVHCTIAMPVSEKTAMKEHADA